MFFIHKLLEKFMQFLKIAAIATLALSAICASAQVYQGEKKGPVIVLASVEVKAKQGCTQVTANTNFPMTEIQCLVLLEKHGRYQVETKGPLMMPIVKDPLVYTRERFDYVYTSTGNGWVFHPL